MPNTVVRFGDFELDLGKYELLRKGEPVKLERSRMGAPHPLGREQGTLVTREMIIERLWGKDVYGETERGINTAINKLRTVLHDDPTAASLSSDRNWEGLSIHYQSANRHQRRSASLASVTHGGFRHCQPRSEFVTPPRVMGSITRFTTCKLNLKVNETKSAVARPQERKFFGFSFTADPEVKRVIAPKALERFKRRIREITRRAKGVSIQKTIEELASYMRGWRSYFGFCETLEVLVNLTLWVRLRLRAALRGIS